MARAGDQIRDRGDSGGDERRQALAPLVARWFIWDGGHHVPATGVKK